MESLVELILSGIHGPTPWLHYSILILTGLLVPVAIYVAKALRQRLIRIEDKLDEANDAGIENAIRVENLSARVSRIETWINGRFNE